MRLHRSAIAIAVATTTLVLLILGPDPANAQTPTCAVVTQPPWPDGCSVGGLFLGNGLDLIFHGACDSHDRCWAQCNGPSPPYLGVAHKEQCDIVFLAHMEAACTFWAPLLSYPDSGWVDADDFLEDCSTVAGVFFTAVNTPFAFTNYWRSQCCRGCNSTACATAVLPLPLLCGRGRCWGSPFPPRPLPPPCPGLSSEQTTTWIVDSTGVPSKANEQLDVGLVRYEGRPESTIYLEEWAILSFRAGRPSVSLVSTADFKAQVGASATLLASSMREDSTMLVVQTANHPPNGRHIPVPALKPFAVELQHERWAQGSMRAFWFRAEVGNHGRVDSVEVLDAAFPLPRDLLHTAIRDNLRLEYADEGRHRVVVFGRGSIGREGVLIVESGLVVQAQCCGDCCHDPELGWLCPCPGN